MPKGLPTGFRSTVTVPANFASQLARSAVVREKLDELGKAIADRATELCPVGTEDEHLPRGHEPGELRDSQRTGMFYDAKGPVYAISYTAFWAHWVHDGTVHSHANPWLLNAALEILR